MFYSIHSNAGNLIQLGLKQCGVATLALFLGACSGITQPYVTARGPVENTAPTTDLSYADAQIVAGNARLDFQSRLEDLEAFDLASGTLLVGAGIAGLAFGLYDAHVDAIYGAALVGGGAAAGRSFLPISTRKKAYLAGSSAINCAIASIGLGEPNNSTASLAAVSRASLAAPGSGNSSRARGSLGSAADELRLLTLGLNAQTLRNTSRAGISSSATSLRSKSAQILTTARSLNNSGASVSGIFSAIRTQKLASSVSDSQRASIQLSDQINTAIDTRGERLLAATNAIISAVNKRIEEAAITPEASLDAALSSATAINTKIKETAASLAEEAEDTKDDAEAAEETANLSASLSNDDAEMTAMVTDTLGDIEEEKAKAEAQITQAQQILSLVEASDSCLEGLN